VGVASLPRGALVEIDAIHAGLKAEGLAPKLEKLAAVAFDLVLHLPLRYEDETVLYALRRRPAVGSRRSRKRQIEDRRPAPAHRARGRRGAARFNSTAAS
jgi:hypothetical protein